MRASRRNAPRATALLLIAAGMALAGCQTDGPGASMAAAPPEPPLTRPNAALICWSKTEKDAARMTLDKRADVVTKCIDDKMRSVGRS